MGAFKGTVTRVAVAAVLVGGVSVGSAVSASADAQGFTYWRGTTLHVDNVTVGYKGVLGGDSGPLTFSVPDGRFDFLVDGTGLNVKKLASSYEVLPGKGLEDWKVKYSFLHDVKTPDGRTLRDVEYAWVWGEDHYSTAWTGFDIVKAPPEGWTAKGTGAVVAQLYVRGEPVPVARVRHKIGLLPGVENRVEQGVGAAVDLVGEAGHKVAEGVGAAGSGVKEAAKETGRTLKRFIPGF